MADKKTTPAAEDISSKLQAAKGSINRLSSDAEAREEQKYKKTDSGEGSRESLKQRRAEERRVAILAEQKQAELEYAENYRRKLQKDRKRAEAEAKAARDAREAELREERSREIAAKLEADRREAEARGERSAALLDKVIAARANTQKEATDETVMTPVAEEFEASQAAPEAALEEPVTDIGADSSVHTEVTEEPITENTEIQSDKDKLLLNISDDRILLNITENGASIDGIINVDPGVHIRTVSPSENLEREGTALSVKQNITVSTEDKEEDAPTKTEEIIAAEGPEYDDPIKSSHTEVTAIKLLGRSLITKSAFRKYITESRKAIKKFDGKISRYEEALEGDGISVNTSAAAIVDILTALGAIVEIRCDNLRTVTKFGQRRYIPEIKKRLASDINKYNEYVSDFATRTGERLTRLSPALVDRICEGTGAEVIPSFKYNEKYVEISHTNNEEIALSAGAFGLSVPKQLSEAKDGDCIYSLTPVEPIISASELLDGENVTNRASYDKYLKSAARAQRRINSEIAKLRSGINRAERELHSLDKSLSYRRAALDKMLETMDHGIDIIRDKKDKTLAALSREKEKCEKIEKKIALNRAYIEGERSSEKLVVAGLALEREKLLVHFHTLLAARATSSNKLILKAKNNLYAEMARYNRLIDECSRFVNVEFTPVTVALADELLAGKTDIRLPEIALLRELSETVGDTARVVGGRTLKKSRSPYTVVTNGAPQSREASRRTFSPLRTVNARFFMGGFAPGNLAGHFSESDESARAAAIPVVASVDSVAGDPSGVMEASTDAVVAVASPGAFRKKKSKNKDLDSAYIEIDEEHRFSDAMTAEMDFSADKYSKEAVSYSAGINKKSKKTAKNASRNIDRTIELHMEKAPFPYETVPTNAKLYAEVSGKKSKEWKKAIRQAKKRGAIAVYDYENTVANKNAVYVEAPSKKYKASKKAAQPIYYSGAPAAVNAVKEAETVEKKRFWKIGARADKADAVPATVLDGEVNEQNPLYDTQETGEPAVTELASKTVESETVDKKAEVDDAAYEETSKAIPEEPMPSENAENDEFSDGFDGEEVYNKPVNESSVSEEPADNSEDETANQTEMTDTENVSESQNDIAENDSEPISEEEAVDEPIGTEAAEGTEAAPVSEDLNAEDAQENIEPDEAVTEEAPTEEVPAEEDVAEEVVADESSAAPQEAPITNSRPRRLRRRVVDDSGEETVTEEPYPEKLVDDEISAEEPESIFYEDGAEETEEKEKSKKSKKNKDGKSSEEGGEEKDDKKKKKIKLRQLPPPENKESEEELKPVTDDEPVYPGNTINKDYIDEDDFDANDYTKIPSVVEVEDNAEEVENDVFVTPTKRGLGRHLSYVNKKIRKLVRKRNRLITEKSKAEGVAPKARVLIGILGVQKTIIDWYCNAVGCCSDLGAKGRAKSIAKTLRKELKRYNRFVREYEKLTGDILTEASLDTPDLILEGDEYQILPRIKIRQFDAPEEGVVYGDGVTETADCIAEFTNDVLMTEKDLNRRLSTSSREISKLHAELEREVKEKLNTWGIDKTLHTVVCFGIQKKIVDTLASDLRAACQVSSVKRIQSLKRDLTAEVKQYNRFVSEYKTVSGNSLSFASESIAKDIIAGNLYIPLPKIGCVHSNEEEGLENELHAMSRNSYGTEDAAYGIGGVAFRTKVTAQANKDLSVVTKRADYHISMLESERDILSYRYGKDPRDVKREKRDIAKRIKQLRSAHREALKYENIDNRRYYAIVTANPATMVLKNKKADRTRVAAARSKIINLLNERDIVNGKLIALYTGAGKVGNESVNQEWRRVKSKAALKAKKRQKGLADTVKYLPVSESEKTKVYNFMNEKLDAESTIALSKYRLRRGKMHREDRDCAKQDIRRQKQRIKELDRKIADYMKAVKEKINLSYTASSWYMAFALILILVIAGLAIYISYMIPVLAPWFSP